MKKIFNGIILSFLFLLMLLSVDFINKAGAAQKVQYGGTLTYFDLYPQIGPTSWDNADWFWKHSYDMGFYMEHLMMGDLQKGPRGTKQYSFRATAWVPPEFLRGELLEKWEVKKNPLRIIFNLRKGVFWQNKPGIMNARELTADDYAYTFNRRRNARKAIPSYVDFIDRVEVVDKHTFILHLKEWNSDWEYLVGWGYYSNIQAPEQEKAPGGTGKWENACGTGPFMLTEYKEGHSQTYTKNPNYWDKETVEGEKYKLPFIDKLVMMLVKDEFTRIALLSSGKVDLMMNINWKHVADIKKKNPQLQWARKSDPPIMMAMRMDTKPFDDIRVRRALNMAIDKQAFINSLCGGQGEMISFPYPPDFTSVFTPVKDLPPAAKELFTYNPERAKKLLAEAGYPNGFTFQAQVDNSSPVTLDWASMVVAYLEKIGVKLELVPMDYPSWLSKTMKKQHLPGAFFTSDHGTPIASIRKAFLSKENWNFSIMNDPHVDKTWEKISTDPNLTQKERNTMLKQLAAYCIEQAPSIWLPGTYSYAAWWPWVKNYYGEIRVGAQRGGPILARVWIDQNLKKKMGF